MLTRLMMVAAAYQNNIVTSPAKPRQAPPNFVFLYNAVHNWC